MRKIAAISDLDALQVSGSGREIAQREALDNVVISRALVESGELHDTKSRENGLRQTKVDIPRLDLDKEFGASGPELQKYYVGDADKLALKIKKLIGVDPEKTDKTSLYFIIDRKEFSSALRMNGTNRIWSFDKKDLQRLASALNLQLKDTNRPTEISHLNCNTEFGISRLQLQKYYVGNAYLKLNKLIGVDPEKTDKSSIHFKIDDEEFSAALRINVYKRIWAFDNKDLARLASVLNLQLKDIKLPLLNSNSEFGASGTELQKYFVGVPSELSRKLKKLIGVDPEKTDKTSHNFKIDGEEFCIAVRKNGAHRIWAYEKKDLARLASVLNLQLKNTNKPTEISLLDINSEFGASGPELQKYYVGNPDKLALKIKKLIGVDPEKTDKTSLNFIIDREEFISTLRMNGTNRIWSFDKKDLSRLASALNLQLKDDNISSLDRNTEFGSGSPELKKYFVGSSGTLSRKLKKLIGVDPEKTEHISLNFKIGSEEFCVALRMNVYKRIWAFKKEDLPRLAKAMNWQLRRQKRPSSEVSRLVERILLPSTLQNSAAAEAA